MKHEDWSVWHTRVLHPADDLLIDAAITVWNGEVPEDGPSSLQPRVGKLELGRTWWVLQLPAHLRHNEVRARLRMQQSGTNP